jgi:hypothetical protein
MPFISFDASYFCRIDNVPENLLSFRLNLFFREAHFYNDHIAYHRLADRDHLHPDILAKEHDPVKTGTDQGAGEKGSDSCWRRTCAIQRRLSQQQA